MNFFAALTLLFIGLKLTGHIDWHWILVLFPLWFMFAIVFVFAVIGFAGCFLILGFEKAREILRKRK